MRCLGSRLTVSFAVVQAVMSASGKRFIIDKQSDPLDFLSWLVNSLHTDLTGGKRKKRSGECTVLPPAGWRARGNSLECEQLYALEFFLCLDLPVMWGGPPPPPPLLLQ